MNGPELKELDAMDFCVRQRRRSIAHWRQQIVNIEEMIDVHLKDLQEVQREILAEELKIKAMRNDR